MRNIDSIIPFCSYDAEYINHCINGVRPVSDNIFVIYADKLFNGENENDEIVNDCISRNSDCKFIKMNYDPNKSIKQHHNLQRAIGVAVSTSDYLLMVDSDEVFEPNKLEAWVNSVPYLAKVTSFVNYWYFRSKTYQATTLEDSPILVKKSQINSYMLNHDLERNIYKHIGVKQELGVLGLDGKPMCHHYSWALTKEQMLKKVDSWGHKYDRNWKSLIEEEFSREFNGTDFVHGYSYNILEKSFV